MDESHIFHESELRVLMTSSLNGDAGAYRRLLERLTGHLRAYYRHRFARIGHGPTEAEDLVQEVLISIHTHRHTYDQLQPFTPGYTESRATSFSTISAGPNLRVKMFLWSVPMN
jgi:tRNA G26 N,N-dimethylase Trm1